MTEFLKNMKAAFFGEPAPVVPPTEPVVAPVALSTLKLKDGTEISVTMAGSELAIGDTVTIAGTPAPAGDHELEDGGIITIDGTGMISGYTPAPPVTQPEFVAAPAPTVEERLTKIESLLANLSTPAMPAGMATEVQLQAATQKVEKHENTIKQMFELLDQIVKEPSVDPVTIPANKKEGFAAKKEERLEAKAAALRELKGKKKY